MRLSTSSAATRVALARLIMTKLSNTALGSIAFAVLVANLFGAGLPFFVVYSEGWASFDLVEVQDDAA